MATITNNPAKARLSAALSTDDLLGLLRQMMIIRRFEERAGQSYQQAKIGGFCHLYIGQEAVAVGSIAALNPDDPVITAYRDHGHALARGMHPNYAMAEMFGKITGCSKGKGGSMHLFDKAHHFYGGHGIVGGQIPLGIGLAFAIQYNREDKVVACYLGDGALNQGAFHESMNLAAIWKLPILIIVENNLYSMGTHISRGTAASEDLSVKAAAYGMRAATCDGMDLLAVYDCIKEQAQLARASGGGGPSFIDIQTYRYQGHSMSDPQKYRTKDEVKQYEENDPIHRLVTLLVEKRHVGQPQLDALDREARQIAVDSVKFAMDSPDTPVEELYTDVYANPFGPYKKGAPPQMLSEESGE